MMLLAMKFSFQFLDDLMSYKLLRKAQKTAKRRTSRIVKKKIIGLSVEKDD
jgi:hypothetical protein